MGVASACAVCIARGVVWPASIPQWRAGIVSARGSVVIEVGTGLVVTRGEFTVRGVSAGQHPCLEPGMTVAASTSFSINCQNLSSSFSLNCYYHESNHNQEAR